MFLKKAMAYNGSCDVCATCINISSKSKPWFCLPLWRLLDLESILRSLILGTNYACDDTAFLALCKALRNQRGKKKKDAFHTLQFKEAIDMDK